MSLALHQLWMLITTVILTLSSVFILIMRNRIPGVFKYNASFLSLFGIETGQASWVQYLFSWIISTCMATVVLTLVVNINEYLVVLLGLGRITLDPVIISLAIAGIVLSILLIAVTMLPILTMPLATPFAFGILLLVHQYGIPINTFSYLPSLLSVFMYFGAIAIGFVGAFLSLYLLFRKYVLSPLLMRYRSPKESSQPTQ
ncbi:MAG: hypothetical protein ACFFCH_10610 [Promethearchaeota archaeon]